MAEVTRRYSNGELAVLWRATLCTHCGNCKSGLPDVFDPDRRPWIDLSKATSGEIRKQISLCPSGALQEG